MRSGPRWRVDRRNKSACGPDWWDFRSVPTVAIGRWHAHAAIPHSLDDERNLAQAMTNRTDINISGARSLGQRTLNERIAAENKLIAEMVGLLKGGVQFQKWPDAAKAALTRAL